MEQYPITKEGFETLEKELVRLKSIERPKVIEEVATARAHGDLKENAEYHAAREKHSFIEGRILDIEDKIARSQVIDTSKLKTDRVVFGLKVTVMDMETEEEKTYHIVGEDEANLENGRISVLAPLSKALIGKIVDDEVRVRTPGGMREYTIVDISR